MNLDKLKEASYQDLKEYLNSLITDCETREDAEQTLDDGHYDKCNEIAQEHVPVTYPRLMEVIAENYSELEDAFDDYVFNCGKPRFDNLRDHMTLSIEWALYMWLRDEATKDAIEEVLEECGLSSEEDLEETAE